MHGLFDDHTRIDYARERAETLREVMLTSRRGRRTDDDAGRHTPTRTKLAPQTPRLRVFRGSL